MIGSLKLSNGCNTYFTYAKNKLNEGNFTCPAFHYGIIGALYHFNLRKKKIDAYGRVSGGDIIDAPKTTLIPNIIAGKRINRIIWDDALTKLRIQGGKVIPDPQDLPFDSFKSDLEDGKFPPNSYVSFSPDHLKNKILSTSKREYLRWSRL